jgi:predicted RNase H-like HicB family nuclease
MVFRALVRQENGVFEAWAPQLHEVRALGASEESALQNLREAIASTFAVSVPAHHGTEAIKATSVEVEIHPKEAVSVAPEREGDPTVDGIRNQFAGGIMLLLLGLTGIVFALFTGVFSPAPWVLFAPVIVAVLGVMGIVMGIASLSALRRSS